MLNPARRDEVPARRPFIRPQQTIAAEQPPVVAHSADSGWGASLPAKAPARSVRNLTRNSISPTRPARPPAMDHRDDVGKVGDTIDPIKWLRRRKPCWSWRSSCACHAGGVPDISRGLSDQRERHPRSFVKTQRTQTGCQKKLRPGDTTRWQSPPTTPESRRLDAAATGQ